MSKWAREGVLQIQEYLETKVMLDGTQDVLLYEPCGVTGNRVGTDDECEKNWYSDK